jgi:hypothetical protein
MADKKQFFRDINPGDVSIEGRQSNGITARSDGSVILYSGVKDNELENLQNYNGNIPVDGYLGNIIAVLKSEQEVSYPIGNNNEETYIESKQIDANKIIITAPSNDNVLYDPCQKLTDADKRKFILDATNYVLSNQGGSKKYTDVDSLDGGTVGIAHFAVEDLGKLYDAMGDAVVKKYFGNDKNGQPMTVDKMKKYYTKACIADRGGKAENDDGSNKFGCYSGTVNPLGIKWKEGMIAFTSDSSNNVIQDNAVYTARVKQIDFAVKRNPNYNTPFDWAVAVGVGNSVPGLFQEWGPQYNWDAAKILEAYIKDADKFDKGDAKSKKLAESYRNHRKRRSDLIYKYFPPCGGTKVDVAVGFETIPLPPTSLPKEEITPPPPAPELEFLPDDFLFSQSTAKIFDDIEYYRNVEIIDGLLWIATAGYSVQVQALYNAEKGGVNSKSKSGKEVIAAAKTMIDKAISQYPMIVDKSKYPDAMNRLLAVCLVAYNECRFTPHNENPNHTFNTAKRAKILKSGWNTLETFYNKFGVKSGDEGKKTSGDAQTANPQNIFNASYCCRYENGDEASGDGYKFRGRGYYGITFKSAYKKTGKVLYGDENKFINDPDLVNTEPIATEMFLKAMFEGGLCALDIGLLAYTTTPANVNGYNIGTVVEVTLPNGTKKKIRGDVASNYTISKGANNLVNGNTAQGYVDNFSNIYGSQELKDYINSKLK